MIENLIRMHGGRRSAALRLPMTPATHLDQLPDGARAIVARVVSASPEVDAVALRRLAEIGFIPGEPVQLLRRGPGGREPLAVLVGDTLFALRRIEARCIEVEPERPATHARPASTSAPASTAAASTSATAAADARAAQAEPTP
jgi:ferrous iron transport protein A